MSAKNLNEFLFKTLIIRILIEMPFHPVFFLIGLSLWKEIMSKPFFFKRNEIEKEARKSWKFF